MGVKSLWEIVGPAARPVKLEALSRKKLAVDASIWIYQFLKAVRDKEGNAMNLSHIVGFFRRICKLLYFGILPLFVFDGGAPALKRQVIQNRRVKREGNRDNMTTAAQKLLAMRLQKHALSAPKTRKQNIEPPKENLAKSDGQQEFTYLSDMPLQHGQTSNGANQVVVVPDKSPQRPFRKKDEYDLPDLKSFKIRKGDERLMPKEEYDAYDEENNWDVVDGIRIDSVDPSSKQFLDLPLATQYMILSHLRLRSRLRLGYTKDQLEELFPNSQDFSKFQIQQVQKRNYYTQKLMNVSGMGEETDKMKRLAGDKDKLYVLVKNDDGWTLSLGGDEEDKPIELDSEDIHSSPVKSAAVKKADSSVASDSDDDLLEDVSLGSDKDEGQELAVVQSIYDQFKADYESPPKIISVEKLADYDPIELKNAIEASKEDYAKIRRQEEETVGNFLEATNNSGFNLGESLLFSLEKEMPKKLELDAHKELEFEDIVEVKEDEAAKEPTEAQTLPKQVSKIPTWFEEKTDFSNPYQGVGFIADKDVSNKPLNEEEEMGIIDWSDAKELLQKRKEESQAELEASDLEIMEEIQLAPDEDDVEVLREKQPPQTPIEETVATEVGIEKPHRFETEYDASYQTERKNFDDVHPQVQDTLEVQKKSRRKKSLLSSSGSLFNISKNTATKTNNASASRAETLPNTIDNKLPERQETEQQEKKLQVEESHKEKQYPSRKAVVDYDIDEEEEELLFQLMDEEEQEHANFTSSLRTATIPIGTSVTEEQLLQEQLLKAKRDAEEVTETMINDVQELLKRFGIPFITAPMEAEAQCAELYSMGMVDGIITDDSDCFLFGGSRIYKNMFNQKQYVECYIAEDIENKVGLNREKLIELALLLGSDYTEGIKGIGPVLAMEILAEFGSLVNFKKWFDKHTKSTVKPNKQSSKLEKTLLTRIKNGKLFLPDSFPDSVVANAYTHAEVDKDDSLFKWGIPRLDQIRSFLMYNVRWTQERVDEVMVPLIQNMNRQRQEGKQSTIGEFFPQEYISYKKDVGLGKRMKVAAKRLKGDEAEEPK